jgi:quercetin dioxygenase-like cupin family protein
MKIFSIVFSLVSLVIPSFQSAVPVEKEPRHITKFENTYARVFDVVLPPGDETLFHTHSKDYFFVMIGASDLKAEILGSPVIDMPLADGEVRFTRAMVTHRVRNVGKTDFHAVAVEILRSAGAKAVSHSEIAGHTLVMDNDRVRIERVLLEPGQSTGVHTHHLGGMNIAVSGGSIEMEIQGSRQTIDIKAGEFRWRDGAVTHSIKNIGKTKFEAIDVEWK